VFSGKVLEQPKPKAYEKYEKSPEKKQDEFRSKYTKTPV